MGHRAIDDTGRVLDLPRVPSRVVSLVPSLTELACALGAGDRLVGVTRYCTDPSEVVRVLAVVGGTKDPQLNQIAALAPDVVLVNSEENRREDFEALGRAGLPLFVSFPTTVAAAARSVERLGTLLGTRKRAVALAGDMERARSEVAAATRQRVRVFCPVWRSPWMSFNRATYSGDLLWCAGGDNLCAGTAERYPTVHLADIAALRPEVILLPDEPYRFRECHRDSLRPLAATPAWTENRIHFVDGQALSWYGPRTPAALRTFHALLGR